MALVDQIPTTNTISPAKHAVIDYGVAATFIGMGFKFRGNNNAAATLAFINAGMVLGVSLNTDYPGGVWKRISFKTHGMLDAVQAALAGIGPILFGFANEPEAKPFYTQAASEVGVIAATDWNAATNNGSAMSVA